jgi:hypothetical protein
VGLGGKLGKASKSTAMPARCSTAGSAVNVGSNHVAVASLASGTAHLPATTSTDAGNSRLQGVVKSGAGNNQLADQMLTEVGDLSIFNESNLDSHREHDRIIDTTIPKEEGKQEAVIKALFGLQPHAETSASQCNFGVTSRSRKDAKTMQLPNDHFLSKMPSWRRSGFSHGYYLQTHLGIMPSGSREVQLRVLHYYLRGGQEIERLQAALNWLLKVTEINIFKSAIFSNENKMEPCFFSKLL